MKNRRGSSALSEIKEEHAVIFDDGRVRIETIKSFGCHSPEGFWYDQFETEVVLVTKGQAVLGLEGKTVPLAAGQSYTLSPHEKHRVESTSGDCEWYCVYVK